MENDDRYDVPDNWEEAADESANRLLQQKIEDAAKLKLELQQQTISDMNGEQQTKLITNVQPPVIKILKRPESSGELNRVYPSSAGAAAGTAASTPLCPSQQAHHATTTDDNKLGSDPVKMQFTRSTGSSSSLSSNLTKSLEERVTAYAQARERIFGVADPVIHEDLPLLPKLAQRTTMDSPNLTPPHVSK